MIKAIMAKTESTRLQLAVRAACEVAEAQGLAFVRTIVLRDWSNAIVHLYPVEFVYWGADFWYLKFGQLFSTNSTHILK